MSCSLIQSHQTLSTPKRFGTPRSTPIKQSPQISTPMKKPNGTLSTPLDAKKKNNTKEEANKENINGSLNGSYVNDPDRALEDEPPPKYGFSMFPFSYFLVLFLLFLTC